MEIGLIGSGSWGTAIAKMLTHHQRKIHWCVRDEVLVNHLNKRHHNPGYLPSVSFNPDTLYLYTDPKAVFKNADAIVIVTPSAYVSAQFSGVSKSMLKDKKIISAVKGLIPPHNVLLNDFLLKKFDFNIDNYYTLMGPCHAEEVAAEKLSYLTVSGKKLRSTKQVANMFSTPFTNTIVNSDVYGVQYAAVLKNVYAVAAGIAQGLGYGDNFLSVLIANSAHEMASFLKAMHKNYTNISIDKRNYKASVYLGDLLVTCYSMHSRNRTFGGMIGKGYTVKAAQVETNMVAEGYNAAKSIFEMNKAIGAELPIAENVYKILWKQLSPQKGFAAIEESLV